MTATYTPETDVVMLREVVAARINPDGKGPKSKASWDKITNRVNELKFAKSKKKVNTRQTKERALYLLEDYKKKCAAAKKLSGINESHSEVESILDEWIEIIEEIQAKKEEKVTEEKDKLTAGRKIREAALQSLSLTPKKKKKNTQPAGTSADSAVMIDGGDNESDSSDLEDFEPLDESEAPYEDDDDQPPKLEATATTKKPTKRERGAPSPSTSKRSKKGVDIMEYLMMDSRLRERELRLQERKLKVEEENSKTMSTAMVKLLDKLAKE